METTLSAPRRVAFGRIAPCIAVQDLDRSLGFYCGVPGFRKVVENGNPVGFVILRKDEAEVHLSYDKRHRASTHHVAQLMVDDAAALHQRSMASGVRIIKSVRDADFGLGCFVMADPDGNRIDVGQPFPQAGDGA